MLVLSDRPVSNQEITVSLAQNEQHHDKVNQGELLPASYVALVVFVNGEVNTRLLNVFIRRNLAFFLLLDVGLLTNLERQLILLVLAAAIRFSEICGLILLGLLGVNLGIRFT